MQSTGHSSMQALSLMSTQGWAIVYVTDVSSTCPPCTAVGCGSGRQGCFRATHLVTDTRRRTYTASNWHAQRGSTRQRKPIRRTDDGSVPELAVSVGSRVHDVTQPRGHGVDAHWTG